MLKVHWVKLIKREATKDGKHEQAFNGSVTFGIISSKSYGEITNRFYELKIE